MYTDFNHFFTVRTRNVWRIKVKLRMPPHLYSVTTLPSKTRTLQLISMLHFRWPLTSVSLTRSYHCESGIGSNANPTIKSTCTLVQVLLPLHWAERCLFAVTLITYLSVSHLLRETQLLLLLRLERSVMYDDDFIWDDALASAAATQSIVVGFDWTVARPSIDWTVKPDRTDDRLPGRHRSGRLAPTGLRPLYGRYAC